jgi:hypothetical protein
VQNLQPPLQQLLFAFHLHYQQPPLLQAPLLVHL